VFENTSSNLDSFIRFLRTDALDEVLRLSVEAKKSVLIHIPSPAVAQNNCSPSYPDVCIAPAPPDLDCKDISHQNFEVVAPDPHKFDGDEDGIGCEEQKNS